MIKSVTWFLEGNKIGCLLAIGMSAFFKRPPTRTTPFAFKHGLSAERFDPFTLVSLVRHAIKSVNASC